MRHVNGSEGWWMLTNCELDLGGSLSCRREGAAGHSGLLSAGPPSRANQCLPQHRAVLTEDGWRGGEVGEEVVASSSELDAVCYGG